jgi:hypothetical protein
MKKTALLLALSLTLAACTSQPASNTATTNAPSMGKRMPMEWVSVQTGTGTDGIPQNKLMLQTADTKQVIATTTCTGTTSTNVQGVDGSTNTIQCWWAGGGDQYGVFVGDAEKLTVRHRTVDEEGGFGTWQDVSSN